MGNLPLNDFEFLTCIHFLVLVRPDDGPSLGPKLVSA